MPEKRWQTLQLYRQSFKKMVRMSQVTLWSRRERKQTTKV